MQFNNPNILYALFVLIIPILVHLFQLRKFQKTAFTNVKFLQELLIQTRKSSQIKKWLILLSRMLIFTCIIIAFAQPYFNSQNSKNEEVETVIYIDNSYSTQAKGEKGELLRNTIQEVLQYFPVDEKISLITNTETYKNSTLDAIKNNLISLNYTPNQLTYKAIGLKALNLFSKNKVTIKRLICISDFQKTNTLDSSNFSNKFQTTLVQTLPVSKNNISVDSAYFNHKSITKHTLNVVIKKQYSTQKNIPLSLYNNDSLISKTSVNLNDKNNTVSFDLPTKINLNLKLELIDNKVMFDNTLYASRVNINKQNILAIGSKGNNAFLSKIFTTDEFNFIQNTSDNVNYSLLEEQHLIILNEIKNIPSALVNNLNSFKKNGGTILCIPSEKLNLKNYNSLLNIYSRENNHKTRLTTINFTHPIFKNVFEKEVLNFQYPSFNKHYQLKNYHSTILNLENGNPLLVSNNNNFIFSAPLNSKNTNFKQAPLIVPTIYNIAKSSLKTGILYYTIGKENTIDIPLQLAKDKVLSIENNTSNFIPLQQIKTNKVTLQTRANPAISGFYNVKNKQETTKFNLAYNYNRNESLMEYYLIENIANNHINTTTSVTNAITQINSAYQVATLWKWFVIFAILFLLVELLILKYFK